MKRTLFLRFLWLFITAVYMVFSPSAVFALTNEDISDILHKHPYFSASAGCAQQNTPGTLSDLDKFLQTLADRESGGNIVAQNSHGSASGKYQYIDTTWQSNAQAYYPPAQQYAHAKDAPEAVQDAVAYIEYLNKFNTFQGDLSKMAISHYYPAALSDESLMDKVPRGGNSLTPRQYAQLFIEAISQGLAKDIPLLYSAAPDFQTYLTAKGGAPNALENSQEPVTTTADDFCVNQSQLGDFVFYSQYDKKWSKQAYGSSTVAESGCGPTSLAMVVATLVDRSVTPKETTEYANSHSYYNEKIKGTDWGLFKEGPQHWNLNSEDLGKNMNSAISFVRTGGLVIASGLGPAPFTTLGHIVVIRGVTANGKLLIGDPARPNQQDKEYDADDVSVYVANMWGISK